MRVRGGLGAMEWHALPYKVFLQQKVSLFLEFRNRLCTEVQGEDEKFVFIETITLNLSV